MEYTEEEKQAIKECESLIKKEYYGDIYFYERRSIQTVLNLIEKQQKEIENQKNIIKEKAIVINNQELDKAKIHNNWQKELKENYVPKEAIREKIDDLQRYKGLVMYEKYNYDAIIRHLKELLG